MMMTINSNKKLFWKKIQKSLPYISSICVILFSIGLMLSLFNQKKKDLKTQSIHSNNGWGYTITNNKKTIIKQTIIPAISEVKSFQTEKEALAVGDLVVQKLNTNNSPTITRNDLILLKIKI